MPAVASTQRSRSRQGGPSGRAGAHRTGTHRRGARRPPPRRRGSDHPWSPATTSPRTAPSSRGSWGAGRPGRPGPAQTGWRRPVATVTTMVDRITPRVHRTARRTSSRTTGRRWSPNRSASGCSAAISPAGGRAGRTPAPRSPTTSRPSRSASCGCSTAAIRSWPTPAPARGHETVAGAVADDTGRGVAGGVVGGGVAHSSRCRRRDLAHYRDALLERFSNPRMRHRLAQIAADGSQKLPIRILPVLRAERAAGRLPDGRRARARGLDRPPPRSRSTGHRPTRGRAGRPRRRPGGCATHPRGPGSALAADDALVASVRDAI